MSRRQFCGFGRRGFLRTAFLMGLTLAEFPKLRHGGMPPRAAGAPLDPDFVIRNGTIHDGTGRPAQFGDVAIQGDRVARIGRFTSAGQPDCIDARGLLIAPGFFEFRLDESAFVQRAERDAPREGVCCLLLPPRLSRSPIGSVEGKAKANRHLVTNTMRLPSNELVRRAQRLPATLGVAALADVRVPSLEQAIRQATGMVADFLGWTERGYLQKGGFADLVLLDPRKRGQDGHVRFLFINGILAIADGKPTGSIPGRILTEPIKNPAGSPGNPGSDPAKPS